MRDSTKFRLNRSGLLLALISSAFAGQVHAAAAGRVEFAIGGATLAGPNGQQRPATRGAEVNSGDVVRTTDGRVQVRMADGSYISLQPNTEFGIKEYRFEGKTDGTESAFYSLLKGAMRTVTGLIGRVNRNRYQVATPTATVGIRGTGGLIQVRDDGSTLVQGTSGIWFLANPSGSINVPAGVAGEAPSDPKQPPKESEAPPTAGPAPLPPEQGYVQGDQTNPDGTAVITGGSPPAVLVSGSGYATAIAFAANQGNGPVALFSQGIGSATFDAAGQMTQLTLGGGASPSVFEIQSGSHADFGTDGILAWGRWVGTVAVPGGIFPTESYTPNQGLHYVIGLPTATMPMVGTATYTMIGATQPTYVSGGVAPGTLTSLGLSVDFQRLTVGVNLNVAMTDGNAWRVGGNAQITGSNFAGSFDRNFGGSLTVAGTSGSACGGASSCGALVQGFFAGASAERAGLAYHIVDTSVGKDVVGAAAFTKQ